MINIELDPRIIQVCPQVQIGAIRAHVVNHPTPDGLWALIEERAEYVRHTYELLQVNERPAIAATRRLYYAISGLDADKLVGDTLRMGVGEAGEPYCGIGRGPLNIEGLPVYRDAQGGVATPTSDEERTKFTPDTRTVQININAFAPEMPLEQAVEWTTQLLRQFADATQIETKIFSFSIPS